MEAAEAERILKATWQWSGIEVITRGIKERQFAGRALLGGSDILRLSHTGGYRGIDVWFDGKTVPMETRR
jgi:hypothetical protein